MNMAEKIVNPFVKNADAENYNKFRPLYHDIPFKWLYSHIGRTVDKALDVACGTGHSTKALGGICEEVIGCDSSAAMLAEARKDSSAEFVLAPAESLPFEDVSFSLVNISMGFHWVDQEKFLSEAARVLKPRGYLSVDNYWFNGRMQDDNGFNDFNKDFYGKHFASPPRHPHYPFEELAKKHGFHLKEEFTYEHAVPMTLMGFVGYCLTQSNVMMSGNAFAKSLLEKEYRPYFREASRFLMFSGMLKLYQTE